MKRLARLAALAFALMGSIAWDHSPAGAAPLTLSYDITTLASGYRYDFKLTLDNHDGSWAAGQEFDWIVIGDRQATSGPAGSFGSWSWTSVPLGFGTSASSGYHNGPTLYFGASVALPGWKPTALGETLAFSGIGANFLDQGALRWSILNSTGVNPAFDAADLTAVDGRVIGVPGPLAGAGLPALAALGVFVLWWRRRAA
jgi:hypothetical protein